MGKANIRCVLPDKLFCNLCLNQVLKEFFDFTKGNLVEAEQR